MMKLSAIYYYPVKSLAGIQTSQAQVTQRGFMHDRRWMLIDESGRFITQRQHPRLALVKVFPTGSRWQIHAPDEPDLQIELPESDAPTQSVIVWQDTVEAQISGTAAAEWFSRFTGIAGVQLVYMPETSSRRVDQKYAANNEIVSFADGFPFLLISQASLDDLNSRMAEPLPMSRFRPNLVVEDTAAFAEDDWKRIRVGDLTFQVAKPCSRCKVTTVDPFTAETGKEPLKTLASYRRWDNEVWFGMNLIHEQTGMLRVGDEVEILE